MTTFSNVDPRQSFPKLEDEITLFWKKNKIFEKSIDNRSAKDKYVFYDGPPFITGTPHYGSLLPSIAKDVVPRYWTMNGKRVERKWGWDCHGLPIENKVEEKIGLKNRRDIEKFGIKNFIDECYKYTTETSAEWEWYVDKIGRWVDFENSYKTMDEKYMESVIWVFKQLWDKDMIYKGTRVSLFCTRCGTPISNFEIAMDNSYADMEDPAVTIKFPIKDAKDEELEGAAILAWTTTPWTLPSNRALVVDEKEDYVVVEILEDMEGAKKGEKLVMAKKRMDAVFGKKADESKKGLKDNGFEVEMNWMVEKLPENIDQYRKVEFEQAYLSTKEEDDIEKRVRKITDDKGIKYEYTTKKYAGDKHETGQLIEKTEKINEEEYEKYFNESKYKIQKTRYYIPLVKGLIAELDVYANGLMFVEVEFDNQDEYEKFSQPEWFSKEVTDVNACHPAYIASHTIEELKAELDEYVQKPHVWQLETSNGEAQEKNYKVVKEIKGAELVGLSYTAPFDYFPPNENDWKVYAYPGMVTMDDGTGIVHSAPGFGEIDTEMGNKVGLTLMMAVNDEGKFIKTVTDYEGMYIKKADPIITEDLKKRNILFKNEKITHRYPFCYRCKTPLIQKAQPSWFIKIQEMKDQMLKSNENINWVPDHLKDGRFKKGIETAPDWCISRTRYWASPMPVWKCQGKLDETAKVVMVHGNGPTDPGVEHRSWHPYLLEEFKKVGIEAKAPLMPEPEFAPANVWLPFLENEMKVDENTILIGASSGAVAAMRYAETHKVKGLILVAACYTDLGDETEKKSGYFDKPWDWEAIKKNTGWIIQYHSKDDPYIIVDEAEFIHEKLDTDFKLTDHDGHFQKKEDGRNEFPEIVRDVKNKLRLSECDEMEVFGSVKEIEDRSGMKVESLHRPAIDKIVFECKKCGGLMERVTEVLDVWMDSGSMPYGQRHYPFENKEDFEANYPADFIVEYIGQTRAWFYVMHVLSNALFNKESFKNVITTGVMFGTDGRKMSKSYGNYPDPKNVLNTYGAEAMRLYFMGSPIMIGQDMNVDENGLKDQLKSFIIPLWNSYSFFVTYANIHNWTPRKELTENVVKDIEGVIKGDKTGQVPFAKFENTLDKWIVARLQKTIHEVRASMEAYNIPQAVREFAPFVNDLSKWYIRRSRSRFNKADAQAMDTLYYVLVMFAKVTAPFMPFISEALWQNLVVGKVDGALESIHLTDFPMTDFELMQDCKTLMFQMQAVREIVNLGQSIRVENGLKVRQPLAEVEINIDSKADDQNELVDWMKDLIKEELNVKLVQEDDQPAQTDGWIYKESLDKSIQISMNVVLTDELKREGIFRELVRTIQAERKKAKLALQDKINLSVQTDSNDLLVVFEMFDEQIKQQTGVASVEIRKEKLKDEDLTTAKKINGEMLFMVIEK